MAKMPQSIKPKNSLLLITATFEFKLGVPKYMSLPILFRVHLTLTIENLTRLDHNT